MVKLQEMGKNCDEELNALFPYRSKIHLNYLLNYFVDRPYCFEPLGEGEESIVSKFPLYRTDCFDCVSFVNIILALLNAIDLTEFKKNILKIRYQKGKINFHERTDWFTDLDWLPVARQLNWLQQLSSIFLENIAETMIDKTSFFQKRFPQIENKPQFFLKPSRISYWSLIDIFKHQKILEETLPTLSFVAIIRPNWDIKNKFKHYPEGYGTNLNVSHVGLLHKNNGLKFYHASSVSQKVVCENFIAYLANAKNEPTIKGIHVEKVCLVL